MIPSYPLPYEPYIPSFQHVDGDEGGEDLVILDVSSDESDDVGAASTDDITTSTTTTATTTTTHAIPAVPTTTASPPKNVEIYGGYDDDVRYEESIHDWPEERSEDDSSSHELSAS